MCTTWGFWVALRLLVFTLWLVCALPLRLLESVVVGVLGAYLRDLLVDDSQAFMAFAIAGLVLSNGVFLPLAETQWTRHGVLCTAYLSSVAWVLGNVVVNILVFEGLTHRLTIARTCPCLIRGALRLRTPGDAGYAGLLLGLSFAFPVAAVRQLEPSAQPMQWCRPSDSVPAEAIYLPVLLCGLLAATVDTSSNASLRLHSAQEREEDLELLQELDPRRGPARAGHEPKHPQ